MMRSDRAVHRAVLVLASVAALCPDVARSQSATDGATPSAAPAHRIVSLNPSLTEILIALGAREALVAVDAYSAEVVPEAAQLPQVGGLYNPSLEAVVAVAPDRVVVVESVEQRDFRRRLERLGIEVSVYQNHSFEEVLDNVRELGRLVAREDEAARRIESVREVWRRVRELSRNFPSPRTILVLQRDPLFIATPTSYIGEMLAAVGAENLAVEFSKPYPRAAMEWLLAASPDLLIDLSADPLPAAQYWSRWPALPAVATGRVVAIDARKISLPGPYLDRSIATLAEAVHGAAFRERLNADEWPAGAGSAPR